MAIESIDFDEVLKGAALCRRGGVIQWILPRHYRDKIWASTIGGIQDVMAIIASTNFLNEKLSVTIDFTRCRWIDPLPLLSLLIEIVHADEMGIPTDICLPAPDDGPDASEIGPYQESPNRLLWFLDQEGFFDSLSTLKLRHSRLDALTERNRSSYRHLRVTPSYEDAGCIPVTIFSVPNDRANPNFAQEQVERLLAGVDSKLDARVPSQTRDRLVYRLRVVLQEALHNAQEHAYESNDAARLLAVYVRYRAGGIGLDTAGRAAFEQHLKEERLNCPGIDGDWLAHRHGCLEVFVLDRGMGMVRRFELSGIPLTDTYKFRQVMMETFIDGRSSKPERQTQYGGLHLLHNLLCETGDYIVPGRKVDIFYREPAPPCPPAGIFHIPRGVNRCNRL